MDNTLEKKERERNENWRERRRKEGGGRRKEKEGGTLTARFLSFLL
jgi:hypothetical protein